MMSKLSRPLALVSVLFLTSLVAVAATESSAPRPVAPPSRAAIHCLGGAGSVPMTADAEQRLPLRLVGDLPCGSVVSILADNQGYTAEVRTEEGVEGYVAHLYLTRNALAASAPSPQAPSASPTNGVVRWQANSPGCTQFVVNGHVAESSTANGTTVQVALEDTGWKLRAIIAVSNNGRETLQVFPSLVTLDELAPQLKSLSPADPAKLSRVVNHQLLLSEASAEPPRDAVTISENGSGLAPAAYQPSTRGYFGDDVFQASASNSAAILPTRTQILALALKHTVLKPGQVTSGVIWFERSAHARELSLRVSTGDLVFDFPLSFDSRK
jgi:hypothetical protein